MNTNLIIGLTGISAVLVIVLVAIYFEQIKRLYRQIEKTRTGQSAIRAVKLSIIAAGAAAMNFFYGLDHFPSQAELLMAGKMILLAALWKFRDGVKLKPPNSDASSGSKYTI